MPCDRGVQTLWSVCVCQVKLCDPLVTHGLCLTSRCCPAWQSVVWLSGLTWLYKRQLYPYLLSLDGCCGRTKCDSAGIESILKKDRGQTTSVDLRSSDREDGRKTNGCGGNTRRVLFKNNVSVYRFDVEPSQPENGAVSVLSRQPIKENLALSNETSHDAVKRPPTVSSSHDLLVNRRYRRSAATELIDDRRVNGQLNSPSRRIDNLLLPCSSPVVGNFEVLCYGSALILKNKRVRKPSKSRLSLTRHANKSSRWAE